MTKMDTTESSTKPAELQQTNHPAVTNNGGDAKITFNTPPISGGIQVQPNYPQPVQTRQFQMRARPQTQPERMIVDTTVTFRLGVTSICFGVCLFLCGIIESTNTDFARMLRINRISSVWVGIPAIICGSFGVKSSSKVHNMAWHVLNLVFNLIVNQLSFTVVVMIFNCMKFLSDCEDRSVKSQRYGVIKFRRQDCPRDVEAAYFGQSCVLLLCGTQFCISIAAIVYCARAFPACRICCKCFTASGGVIIQVPADEEMLPLTKPDESDKTTHVNQL